MLTGDLDRLLAAEIGALPPPAVTTAGTWQPAPPDGAPAPGTYGTPVAFRLAGGHPARALRIAMTLAAALRRADWVCSATVTGGYVTVSVTPDALARLAVRIVTTGAGCARSTALAGTTVPAPPDPDLAAAPGWADAWRRLAAHLTGRLAEAAGARTFPALHAERHPVAGPGPDRATGPVADAIGFAGASAIRYALARIPPGTLVRVDPGHAARRRLDVPAYAVRYAHSRAASTLRQAADLSLSLGEAAEFGPQLLAHPSERALLGELSWLPERVAGAARRGRPDTLPRYLERLAGAYLDCQERCPAVWPGIRAGGPQAVARLWLAAASATALRAGLDLLGVDAPDRL
ncbi:MAG TPA: DALR anticodon-binding domain-containing protein [Streptosporangiaceae bacterium]|nr:DALR anticodon-binding domain-containing protein [Streptosporangiaceae bacterium]